VTRPWLPAALLLLLTGCAAAPAPPPAAAAPLQARPVDAEFPGSAVAMDLPWVVVEVGGGLVAHNLESGKSINVPVAGTGIAGFAVSGGKLVWSDLRNEKRGPAPKAAGGQTVPENRLNWDVMLLDLASGEVRPLSSDPAAQRHPHTDGRYVVWEDFRNDHTTDDVGFPDVYIYDLQSGKERRLSAAGDGAGGQFWPRVDGGRVVWVDGRNNAAGGSKRACTNCPDNNWNIYYYDIAAGREYPAATHQYMETGPDLAGDRMVWLEREGFRNTAVVLLDLKSGQRQRLTDAAAERPWVRVAGARVVWADGRRNEPAAHKEGSDVCYYDAATGKAACLTDTGVQTEPVVSDNRIAWVQNTANGPRVQVVTVP